MPASRASLRHATGSKEEQGRSAAAAAAALAEEEARSALLSCVLPRLHQLLPRLDNQGLANVVHSLARLGHFDPALLDAMLRLSQPRLIAFTPQNLANIMLGLGQLRYKPGPYWLASLFTASSRHLAAGACSPRALVMMIWALARLRVRPHSSWMRPAMASLKAHIPVCSGPHLVVLLHALGQLRYAPSPTWMHACTFRMLPELPSLSGLELLTLLCSLADLRFPPSGAWLCALKGALHKRVFTLTGREACHMLHALARLARDCGKLLFQTDFTCMVSAHIYGTCSPPPPLLHTSMAHTHPRPRSNAHTTRNNPLDICV